MNIISINNVIKNYQLKGIVVQALKGINLTIRNGEFTAIAGPSGSGKTTLLNIIGGLDSITSGTVTIGDKIINNLSQRDLSNIRLRDVGFIFQSYNLIPVLSAMENVEYILLLQGIKRQERLERTIAILKEVGLEKEMNRRPHELSGGQQQRVAVARAIVAEPKIVLADEPTASLDQNTGRNLIDLMHELNRRKGITFLFSTHDKMVMDRTDRLVHLRDGIIIDEVNNQENRQ